MTQASICTIGDEILIGQIVDTNSSHISQALNTLGIKVTRMLSIGDDHDIVLFKLSCKRIHNHVMLVAYREHSCHPDSQSIERLGDM